MRKIWASRREKDKRKSLSSGPPLIHSNNQFDLSEVDGNSTVAEGEFNDDYSTLANSAMTSIQESANTMVDQSGSGRTSNGSTTNNPKTAPRSVASLVKFDYDSKIIKNGWLNGIVNSHSVNEISEQTLRLFRVELKGSHLYLYKPLTNFNAKNFRINDVSDSTDSHSLPTTASSDFLRHSNNSNVTIHDIGLPTINQTPITGTMPIETDYLLTYFNTKVPHPDLNFDFDAHKFLNNSSVESILHFILFDTEKENFVAIDNCINILPLFPKFGKTLKLLHNFIQSAYSSNFEGDFDLELIIERVLRLLINIQDNFIGFLLKSDIAPYIIKILEVLTENLENDQDKLSKVQLFQSNMLSKQQFLINLVTNVHLDASDNPFQDLNSTAFIKDINLIEMVTTISFIDLKFFKSWNSSIDKSLLLNSSINDGSLSSDFFYKKNPLIFHNDMHIHYLSRLLINHLFIENTNSLSTSNLEKKARVLEKWIDLGCILDKSGNMSSWLGISSIILSQPILRLTKIWSLVSPDYIKLLKNDWSPVLFELERRYLTKGSINNDTLNSSPNSPGPMDDINTAEGLFGPKDSFHIIAPRGLGKIYPKENVVPYFGDLLIKNSSTSINELESIWKRINYSFTRWNEYLSNLVDCNKIIEYNKDVLKRYDDMDFIFSNESLNQVLYLGVNNDNGKPLPPRFDELSDKALNTPTSSASVNIELQNKLLRLIEVNCDSINLEKIMKMSLVLEPDLPESYLKLPSTMSIIPSTPLELSFRHHNHSSSNISIHSNDSSNSLSASSMSDGNGSISNNHLQTLSNEFNPASKLPTFNNNYFKINLSKYDELTMTSNALNSNDTKPQPSQYLDPSVNKHNFIVDNELTFRIDDFVTDINNSMANSTTLNAIDDIDNIDDDDDDPGLGIDVDDILNSEKFNSFTISPNPNTENIDNSSDNKKKNDYSVISSDSSSIGVIIPTYKYIPKYATIDKLIDILLIDSKYFDEQVSLDLTEYRFVFLLNYNSFITTRELLDKLAHRFVNSGNAVISIMKKLYMLHNGQLKNQHSQNEFPNWNLDTSIDLNELGEVDYDLLLKIQINILKVLIVLLTNFYTNFSLHLANKKILIRLLKLYSNEILQWYNSNKIDSNLERSFESLVNYYKKLKNLFVKKTYRPIEISKFDEYLINEFRFSNSLHEVPMNRNLPGHKNVNKIEKFLHKFNKLLAVLYKGIKSEEWIKVYKILEYQFENNALLEFNLQKNTINDDNFIISNIFNFFESLTDPLEKQLVLERFPLIFRKLFKLYFKFRSYLLVQLTDSNITVDEKLDRMKTLLIMYKLAQLKMSEHQFIFEGGKGNIPSCIETAITNVIYSPESRLFGNLWIKASHSLNRDDIPSYYEDINSLLPRTIKHTDLQYPQPLLPCFGWIIENLIEANKCPSFFKQTINFNKRYLIYKLIKELTVEDIDGSESPAITYHDTKEFDFLLRLDETLVSSQSIKDLMSSDKDRIKLFRVVLRDQHKILIIDNKKKQSKDNKESAPGSSHSHTLNKKSSNSSLRRQSFSYKSNSASRFKISGFFTKSRPFSLNVSGISSNASDKSISVKELPNPDTHLDSKQKPFLVVPLKNRRIFPVYLLPLCFKIDTESNNEDYFFQAPHESELNDWLVKLSYANRHWFYSRILNLKTNHYHTTFGIPINVICNREKSLSPKVLDLIFEEIENEGVKDVGIYRISSSMSELTNIKSIIDKTGTISFAQKVYDVHTLTSIVKSFFRELPDALLTDKVIDSFFSLKQSNQYQNDQRQIQSYKDEKDDDSKQIENYREILKLLPSDNYHTLKALLKHLQKISQYSNENKMTASNLATVIGPALTEASSLDSLISSFGFMNSILEKLITNYDYVFGSNDTFNAADRKVV